VRNKRSGKRLVRNCLGMAQEGFGGAGKALDCFELYAERIA
jgi:hypothetical protein